MDSEWALDLDAIRQLKARYFRFIDTKRWDDLRTVFADDCRFEGTALPYASPDAFVAGTRARLGPAVTVHQGHMPEIVRLGPGHARGIWASFDHVEFASPIESGRGAGHRGWTASGYYEEEYRTVDGEWRISFFRQRRLRADAITAEHPPPHVPGWLAVDGGDWLRDGPGPV